LRRAHAQSDIATLLFCPAALCPLRLPRTRANVCLLAVSSSCKTGEKPRGRGRERDRTKREAGEEERAVGGRRVTEVMEEEEPSAVMIFIGA